jgi:hypothetical protein
MQHLKTQHPIAVAPSAAGHFRHVLRLAAAMSVSSPLVFENDLVSLYDLMW